MRTFFLAFALILSFFSLDAGEKNRLVLCRQSLELLDFQVELIRAAQSQIEIHSCLFGGTICQKLLDEIGKRMDQVPDIQVHIIASPVLLDSEDRQKIEGLIARFPDRFHFLHSHEIPFIMPNLATIHDHAKFAIFDGRYFTLGGTNLDELLCSDGSYTPPRRALSGVIRANQQAGARDQDVVGRGPLADELRALFYTLWELWDGEYKGRSFNPDPESVKDKVQVPVIEEDIKSTLPYFERCERVHELEGVRLIFSGPMHRPNQISEEYVRLIRGAKSEVVLSHMYFNPITAILDALKEGVNRKLRVQLITNGAEGSAPASCGVFAWANRINYLTLFKARDYRFWESDKAAHDPVGNVEIYEYAVPDVLYHKKMMVVDRHLIILGSYNLGIKSDEWDYETVLVIDSEEMAEELLEVLEQDRTLSVKVSPEQASSWYFSPVSSFLGMLQKQLHTML